MNLLDLRRRGAWAVYTSLLLLVGFASAQIAAAKDVTAAKKVAGSEKTASNKTAGDKKATAKKQTALPKEVTYSKHIAPVLWKNCAGCHRPGEVGPFSLLTYDDAAKRADFLVEVTGSRQMPPWKPEPNFGKFHDERRLADRDIQLIAKWAKSGAPEGNKADLPEPPKFPEGWQLGEPDLVLKMSAPFEVPASGRDIYRCFVIPIPVEKDRVVTGVEFRPGNRKIVHHAIMYLDANGAAQKLDGKDGKPGYATFGGPGIMPTGGLGAWAPGAMPRFLPDGIVKYMKKGSDLVLQIHYHPDGKPERDESVVGVYFSKQPIKKIVTGIAVMQTKLNIPADDAHCEITAQSQELPVNVHVLGVSPHMHNLGREFKVTATIPDKSDEVPLIWIKDWDFNWQGSYQFAQPIDLPKGSVIKVHAVYDNSAKNPKNPNIPPKQVHWGEQTTDEMCLCGVQVFTDKITELKQVAAMRGNELGAGLDGGIPGQADAAKKKALAKAQVAKKAKEKQTAKRGAAMPDAANQVAENANPADAAAGAPGQTPTGADEKKSAEPVDPKKLPFPPEGLVIPAQFKEFLVTFDTNSDGKLSAEEVDLLPDNIALRVREYAAKQMAEKKGK